MTGKLLSQHWLTASLPYLIHKGSYFPHECKLDMREHASKDIFSQKNLESKYKKNMHTAHNQWKEVTKR